MSNEDLRRATGELRRAPDAREEEAEEESQAIAAPSLTLTEERALLVRYKTGANSSNSRLKAEALDARDKLIETHMPIVRSVARNLREPGIDEEDLWQEGAIALLRVIDIFDLERRARLSSYALIAVHQAIENYVRGKRRNIYVPLAHSEFLEEAEAYRDEQFVQRGEVLSDYDVARHFELPPAKFRKIRKVLQPEASYEELRQEELEMGDDGIERALNNVEDTTAPTPFIRAVSAEAVRDTDRILRTISRTEELSLRTCFGIPPAGLSTDTQERDYEEAARLLGLTRERIRQKVQKGMRNLRHPSRSKRVRPYLVDDIGLVETERAIDPQKIVAAARADILFALESYAFALGKTPSAMMELELRTRLASTLRQYFTHVAGKDEDRPLYDWLMQMDPACMPCPAAVAGGRCAERHEACPDRIISLKRADRVLARFVRSLKIAPARMKWLPRYRLPLGELE